MDPAVCALQEGCPVVIVRYLAIFLLNALSPQIFGQEGPVIGPFPLSEKHLQLEALRLRFDKDRREEISSLKSNPGVQRTWSLTTRARDGTLVNAERMETVLIPLDYRAMKISPGEYTRAAGANASYIGGKREQPGNTFAEALIQVLDEEDGVVIEVVEAEFVSTPGGISPQFSFGDRTPR